MRPPARSSPGRVAGTLTGVIHTRFRINRLLSGILVMTALYSVNLHVMGKSNVPLLSERTLATLAEARRGVGSRRRGGSRSLGLERRAARRRDAGAGAHRGRRDRRLLLYVFFRTNLGTAMQAAGDNPQMIRALGVNVENMIVLGLALSNGLVALSGALLAQYQGFADVQMGIGMVVWGLASIIIGEALVGVRQLGFVITGAVMGSVLFRLLVAIALRGGLDPNDLKLVTAAFVFVALDSARHAAAARLGSAHARRAEPSGRRHEPPRRTAARLAPGRCCSSPTSARRSTRDTPNEVRALQGVNLTLDEGRFVDRDRHQRLWQVDAAQRRWPARSSSTRARSCSTAPTSPAGPSTGARSSSAACSRTPSAAPRRA